MEMNTHRHNFLLDAPADRVFRISLRHGDVFRLRGFSQIDISLYGHPDGWCATVVELVSSPREMNFKLFRPGSGVDFYESDISEIVDESTGNVKFSESSHLAIS